MKLHKRNLTPFYYSLFVGIEKVFNEDGRQIGTRNVYAKPVKAYGNISANRGQAQIEMFGNFEQYSKTVLVDDTSMNIDENSILFIDKEPTVDDEGTYIFDYIVKQVSSSNNFTAYAIDKVKVS